MRTGSDRHGWSRHLAVPQRNWGRWPGYRRGRLVLAGLLAVVGVVARLDIMPLPGPDTTRLGPIHTAAALGDPLHPIAQLGSATTADPSAMAAYQRIRAIGQRLMQSLDSPFADSVSFHIDSVTPAACSYSYPDGRIVVTAALSEALARDAWLATLLAYETANLLHERLGGPHANLHALVIDLLVRAGYDPREISVMGDWVCRRTSLAGTRPEFCESRQFVDCVRGQLTRVAAGPAAELVR